MLQRRSSKVVVSLLAERQWCLVVAPAAATTPTVGNSAIVSPKGRLLRQCREQQTTALESWRYFATDSHSNLAAVVAAAASPSSASDNNGNNVKNITEHESIGKSKKAKKNGGRNTTTTSSYQKSLLEYTQSLLLSSSPASSSTDESVSSSSSYSELGTLPHTKIMEISHCIQQWISSGEHAQLGADQALLLLHRLIFEKMIVSGRQQRLNEQPIQRLPNKDQIITWEMLHIPLIIHCLNELYTGQDFVDKMMSIVAMFETGEEMLYHDQIMVGVEKEVEGRENSRDVDSTGWEESVPYKSIIALLCDVRTIDAAFAAELILNRFESRLMLDINNNSYCYTHANPPTTETYNRIISCWYSLSRGEGIDVAAAAGQGVVGRNRHIIVRRPATSSWPYNYHPNPCSNLLSHMIQLYNSDRNSMARMKPDRISFNIAISSLSKDQQADSFHNTFSKWGKVCYDHIMTMLDYYNSGDTNCAPDLITFSTVLHTLARGMEIGDEERAREVLDVMLYLSGVIDSDIPSASRDYEFDVLPRNMHFNIMLALMAGPRGGQERGKMAVTGNDALDVAKRYVGIMEKLQQNEERDLTSATNAGEYRRLSEYSFAEYRNEDYIRMVGNNDDECYPPNGFTNAYERDWGSYDEKTRTSMSTSAPDIFTYNTLLSIAARIGQPEKAEEILESMIERSSSGKSPVKPDIFSFNTVLQAWSKSKGRNGRLKTEEILHRMKNMADNGDALLMPDRTSMTIVINAITSSSDKDAHIQAERIIELMEGNEEPSLRPDVVTYTSLIKCWAESGRLRAGRRAEEIIHKLHQRYDKGYVECKPDAMVYNVALNAIARSGDPNAPKHAEALLNRMMDCYHAGDFDLAPTTETFSTAILAWARSNDQRGAMKAERLLQILHDFADSGSSSAAPNTICYSTCILAWKNSGHRDAGIHAQSLIEKMEAYENRGMPDLKPNVIAFTNAMEAWINSRHPDALEQVEAILERMEDRAKNGDPESEPTTTTMNVVMKAIRHSSLSAKYKKAEELLNRMKWMDKRGVGRSRPNVSTYNAFFSACAMTGGTSQDKMNAFSSVLSSLIELQDCKHLHSDSYTWPAVWKACENLLDVEKDMAWINHVFELTIRSGSVNQLLFNNIRRFLPAQYLQKKLRTNMDVHRMTVHQLPSDWTCNVKLSRDRGQRNKQ